MQRFKLFFFNPRFINMQCITQYADFFISVHYTSNKTLNQLHTYRQFQCFFGSTPDNSGSWCRCLVADPPLRTRPLPTPHHKWWISLPHCGIWGVHLNPPEIQNTYLISEGQPTQAWHVLTSSRVRHVTWQESQPGHVDSYCMGSVDSKTVPGSVPGCRTGNGGKISNTWFDGLNWFCLGAA